MDIIELSSQPIELCKLLKAANMVGGGGEAKIVISEGYVLVNGEVETQKRKKIYHDDVVEFNGEQIQIHCDAPVVTPVKKNKPATNAKPQLAPSSTSSSKKGGRRRINF